MNGRAFVFTGVKQPFEVREFPLPDVEPDGILVLELGTGQLAAVEALLAGEGLAAMDCARRDLTGVPRALAVKLLP